MPSMTSTRRCTSVACGCQPPPRPAPPAPRGPQSIGVADLGHDLTAVPTPPNDRRMVRKHHPDRHAAPLLKDAGHGSPRYPLPSTQDDTHTAAVESAKLPTPAPHLGTAADAPDPAQRRGLYRTTVAPQRQCHGAGYAPKHRTSSSSRAGARRRPRVVDKEAPSASDADLKVVNPAFGRESTIRTGPGGKRGCYRRAGAL
jgi:hypothetical protein